MIVFLKADLLSATTGHIIHGCNAKGKMNSGVAKAVRERYPSAFNDYKSAELGGGLIPGDAIASPASMDFGLCIWNLITQKDFGYDGAKYFDPEALRSALVNMKLCIEAVPPLQEIEKVVHTPRIGCGLGGGAWEEVEPILLSELSDYQIKVYDYDAN